MDLFFIESFIFYISQGVKKREDNDETNLNKNMEMFTLIHLTAFLFLRL